MLAILQRKEDGRWPFVRDKKANAGDTRHWIPIDHYRTIDPGFICCWLDVKRIARSKSPSNDKWLSVTRNEHRGGGQVHDLTYALHHTQCRVQIFFNSRLDLRWCTPRSRRLGPATWSDNFSRCQRSDTLEHYAADTVARRRPVCYVRRGNLSFAPELDDDDLSKATPRWPARFALGYVRSTTEIEAGIAVFQRDTDYIQIHRIGRDSLVDGEKRVISRLLQSVGSARVKYL